MATKPISFGHGLRPFFNQPDSVKPPPGFRYIVLPAEPQTEPPKVERRRLADNVICLFNEGRHPVVNMRWRGRYPRNVIKRRYVWTADRIHAGDFCVYWPDPDKRGSAKNEGVIVKVIERKGYKPEWSVRAINRPLATHLADDPDNPAGHQDSWTAICQEKNLRRCQPPGGHQARRGDK